MIKQCPFCKSKERLVVDGPDGCYITCGNCLASIRAETLGKATDKWNTRGGKLSIKQPINCTHCGDTFTPGHTARGDTKYCSPKCKMAAFQKRKKRDWATYLQPRNEL